MGFAASQARLLVLTARKSDLEFRAQQITNAEMMLAMRSEEVANKYSRALSNQTIKLIDGGDTVTLTPSSLSAAGFKVYQVKEGSKGEPDFNKPWSGAHLENEKPDVQNVWKFNKAKLEKDFNQKTGIFAGKDENSADILMEQVLKGCTGKVYYKEADLVIKVNGETINVKDYFDCYEETSGKINATGDDIGDDLLEGITRGQLVIVDASNNVVSVHNGTAFSVCYDTSDDEKADAEYRSETSAIQVKEKRLQMEMTQVEAQQKACDNEIESIKKWRDKNIDTMFKYAG